MSNRELLLVTTTGPILTLHRLRWLIVRAFLAAIVLTVAAWFLKGRLADPSEVEAALLQEPVQQDTSREFFSFAYKGKACRVQPVASYELWGLVVSHNNIRSIADIYHDSTSVDTKDLCVIWGENLESRDFRQVDYSSGPWTCYFSYPQGVKFVHRALSNNHLITDDPDIRRSIGRVNVGDQVHLRGLLVDYQMDDWQDFWRQTSTVRKDTGCEVVYVEEIQVLRRGTPGWYAAYRLGRLLLVLLPLAYVFVIWLEAGRPEGSRLGEL